VANSLEVEPTVHIALVGFTRFGDQREVGAVVRPRARAAGLAAVEQQSTPAAEDLDVGGALDGGVPPGRAFGHAPAPLVEHPADPTPASATAAASASASVSVRASGFSSSTALPAFAACMASAGWAAGATAKATASDASSRAS